MNKRGDAEASPLLFGGMMSYHNKDRSLYVFYAVIAVITLFAFIFLCNYFGIEPMQQPQNLIGEI